MTERIVRIESIQVVGRHRKDLGDIESLAASIKREGLISPVVLTPTLRLLAGERRLAAVRRLGRDTIEARIVDTLDDAANELRIERDENTQRKAMTPSELVALGRKLEALEAPRAASRVGGRPPKTGGLLATGLGDEETGKTRDIVASAVGMSTSSYRRAREVVEAATDPALSEVEREAAREAAAEMDSGAISITAAHERVTSEKKIKLGRALRPLEGARLQRQGMKRTLPGLLGMATAFDLITEVDPAITDEEVRQWVADLSKARLSIERLIKRLNKERNSEQS